MSADILDRLDFMLISRRSDEDAIIRDARAEIVRRRGEVDARITPDWVIGYFPADVAEELKRAVRDAFGEWNALSPKPAPAMPNGVEGLSPAWHCTNCRNTFTATDALWKGHSDRCAPKCPNCRADSQYTYPEGVGGLIDKLEHYGFECQGGTLTNCSEWSELIRALRAADNRDAAGVSDRVRDLLLERRNRLMNSFGGTPYEDGRVQQQIDAIANG